MTRISFSNDQIVFRDGRVGTESECCCCKVPCGVETSNFIPQCRNDCCPNSNTNDLYICDEVNGEIFPAAAFFSNYGLVPLDYIDGPDVVVKRGSFLIGPPCGQPSAVGSSWEEGYFENGTVQFDISKADNSCFGDVYVSGLSFDYDCELDVEPHNPCGTSGCTHECYRNCTASNLDVTIFCTGGDGPDGCPSCFDENNFVLLQCRGVDPNDSQRTTDLVCP